MTLQLRVAFDIGSGATKVCGAIVRQSQNQSSTVEKVLFEREQPVLVGQAVKNESPDGKTIPIKTINEIQELISDMLSVVHAKLEDYKKEATSSPLVSDIPEQRFGIATAIFRVATNGAEVLSSIERKFNIPCQILSQDEEATLGYETAKQMFLATAPPAVRDLPNIQLVSYDSGGASFQLCTHEHNKLNYFNGQWGSTISHLALLKLVPNIKNQYDPNPVGPDAAIALHKAILDDLHNDAKHPSSEREFFQKLTKNLPQYHLSSKEGIPSQSQGGLLYILGIGGTTSAFNMCSKVLGGAQFIDRSALWREVLENYCFKTNDELIALGFVQPEVLVAKLILVYTVLTHLGLDGFHFAPVVGNTRAVISREAFWNNSSAKL